MFCRNCGVKISARDGVCHNCGMPQKSSRGGNGFWDIINDNNNTNEASLPETKCNSVQKAEKKTPTLLNAISTVISVISLLCSLIAVTNVISVKNDLNDFAFELKKLSDSFEATELSLDELKTNVLQLQVNLEDLIPAKTDDPGTDNDAESYAGDNSVDQIKIIKEPSDQPVQLGGTCTAFTVKVVGSDCDFRWQREVNGSWTDIEGQQGYSSKKEYDSTSDITENKLNISNATHSMSGSYRCIITKTNAEIYTTTVKLAVQSLPEPEQKAVEEAQRILPDDDWAPTIANTPQNVDEQKNETKTGNEVINTAEKDGEKTVDE